MLDGVGESTPQNLSPLDNTASMQEVKTPNETDFKGAKVQLEADAMREYEHNNSSHVYVNGRIYFERYNSDGEVILRLPQIKNPVNEMV